MKVRADRRVGLLLAGVALLLFVSIGATVALPASDPGVRSKKGARTLTATQARGMAIYRNEGCWYCHTQQVRNTPADKAFGKSPAAGAYSGQSPPLLGHERIGPDLTHVGSRYGDAAALIELLRSPRADGRSSSMPSYSYLSDEDLAALSAYLLSLR